MTAAPKFGESRRAARDTVSFRAAIAGSDGSRDRVLLVDLSPFGFMARSGQPYRPGDAATLTLPAIGEVAAIVRWTLAGRIGGEFETAIAAHDYARLLAAAPHDRPSWNEV